MQQSTSAEPRLSQTDRVIERYRALRKLNYLHPAAVFQAAREFGIRWEYLQRELSSRSAKHRQAKKVSSNTPPPPRSRPEVAPASSVPAGDR